MASDAFERASKRLERPSEALLAEMITRDAALRQEAAAGAPPWHSASCLASWGQSPTTRYSPLGSVLL